ncbi:transglutaminase domain-containing protein [Candidatus Poribacteria bacterium]|nr:transglutaminase domain-containing protein [Candidatus Poribacteria bacterium]
MKNLNNELEVKMITLKGRYFLSTLILFILWCSGGYQTIMAEATQIKEEKLYYALEINEVLCGYSEINTSPLVKAGKEMTLLEQKTFALLSALGSEFNTEIKLTYHIDPGTGKFTYHDSNITQGPAKLDSAIYIEGDTARFTTTMSDKETSVTLPPDVILENTLFFPHLKKDFVDGKLEKKSYDIYEVRENEVQKTTYTRVGTEELELAGKIYNAIVLDKLNHKTGLKLKWWLDIDNGYLLKAAYANRISYRSDASVVKKIKIANLDENISTKANVSIADFQGISYMKVKATIEPTGLWVTPESLNVPGQRFTGTVKDNLIEGVFEIEHKRYDGSEAPAFPPDFSKDESLKKYLEAEEMVESSDSVLIPKAQEITEGSKDSWEATRRLSKWVAENISYTIPGGSTARKTYDIKAGECGAHSLLLAAFCRAVGIPARVVWGCMYAPNFGGCFGQHAWNEIYMGKAGWIPVDATAAETDYVDSGHIRIGAFESLTTALNAKEMEVLDYRVGSMKVGKVEESLSEKYKAYVGNYTDTANNNVLKVFVQDGNLTVDIPGKIVLALNDPDEAGLWYSKITNQLYFIFNKNDAGEVAEMELHQIIPLPKKSGPEKVDESVPAEFRPYPGKYFLAALQAEFTVQYKDGSLAVDDPLAKQTIKLQLPDEKGRWVDEFNKNAIFFDLDDEGNVKSMNIDSVSRFRR